MVVWSSARTRDGNRVVFDADRRVVRRGKVWRSRRRNGINVAIGIVYSREIVWSRGCILFRLLHIAKCICSIVNEDAVCLFTMRLLTMVSTTYWMTMVVVVVVVVVTYGHGLYSCIFLITVAMRAALIYVIKMHDLHSGNWQRIIVCMAQPRRRSHLL